MRTAAEHNRRCYSCRMDFQSIGRTLLVVGIALGLLGGLLLLLGRLPLFGNLPGDIRVEWQGFSCFVPVISMILLSVVLTIVFNIIIRFLNRP